MWRGPRITQRARSPKTKKCIKGSVLETICILENETQNYAWGSETAIPELLGIPSENGKPVAELWMGAHPKAPSKVVLNGKRVSLANLIQKEPEKILGPAALKFANQLPYLFKVLAAEHPLSIQAHPNRETAIAGFEKENRNQIPLNAPERNYRDANHKPECICALTQFWGLKGFRKITDVISLLDEIRPKELEHEIGDLRNRPDSEGLTRSK